MFDHIYQDFVDFLDSLFFEGYAEQLAAENPEQFNQEMKEYFDNYTG